MSQQVILLYADTYTATTTFSDRVFIANGMYDTNNSGVGAQPTGFDQWMALYTKFEVLKLDYEIKYYNLASAVVTECAVYPALSSSAFTSILDVESVRGSKFAVCSGTSGIPSCTLRGSVNIKEWIGRTTASANFTGSATADPSTKVFLHVVVGSVDGVTNMNCQYRARFRFHAMFFSPQLLQQS